MATRNAPVISPSSTQVLYLPDISNASPSRSEACTQHAASLGISASKPELRASEVLTITLTLANTGCALLGLPKYYLATGSDPSNVLFESANPEPVLHTLGIDPGGSDTATFTLRAVKAGEAALAGTVSFEVHLGYPGPAYWATASSGPLIVSVITLKTFCREFHGLCEFY